MSTARSAIGGAIDRATLALLWLGRGVFALTTLATVYWVGVAAHTWWTMPQDRPANFTPIKHNPTGASVLKVGTHKAYTRSELERRKSEATRSGKPPWDADPYVFALELPNKAILQVLAFDDDAAFAGAREWWRNDQLKRSRARIEDALWRPVGAFFVGAIFLGLTRVTRWIATGR